MEAPLTAFRAATSAVPLPLRIKNMDEQTIFLIVQIAP